MALLAALDGKRAGGQVRGSAQRRRGARSLAVAISVMVAVSATACSRGLSSDSTCADYLAATYDEQQAIVGKLVEELHAARSLLTPLGFPEIAYQCGADGKQSLAAVIKSVEY